MRFGEITKQNGSVSSKWHTQLYSQSSSQFYFAATTSDSSSTLHLPKSLISQRTMVIWLLRSSTTITKIFNGGRNSIESFRRCWNLQRSLAGYNLPGATPAGDHFRAPTSHAPDAFPTPFYRRLCSTTTAARLDHGYSSDEDSNQLLEFPGGRVGYTSELRFMLGSNEKRVPCYRVLDDYGDIIPGSQFEEITEEVAVRMYKAMASLQVMDSIFYEAQRQGRISFYLTTTGEEAVNIAAAAALRLDDVVFAQYREPGVLLWRGFSPRDFADQLFGNRDDLGKGRQMPIHYGSQKHNYFTVSSPMATQLPQAVGAAYSLKMENKDACALAFIGDGGTSEGDFHAALNFAAVLRTPVIFLVRNNGWAISTHTSEQFRSDGIVVKGPAYGIQSIRVDGNDAVALYSALQGARKIAISERSPVLVEAMTYRVGHHSTSDDSTKYRPAEEIEYWKEDRNPVNRFRRLIEGKGWWNERLDSQHRIGFKAEILKAIQAAEKTEKASVSEMFNDVYDQPTPELEDQEKRLKEILKKYPNDYPTNVPL